jgi:hypothetical protein
MQKCIYVSIHFRLALITLIATIPGPLFSQLVATGDTTICQGGNAQLSASGGSENYYWFSYPFDSSLLIPQQQNPVVSPRVNTMYVVQSNIVSDNIVINGRFDMGPVGFNSEYVNNQVSIEAEGTYAVVNDAHLVHPNFVCSEDHTSGSGNFMAVNGAGIPDVEIWSITLNDIQPNTDYEFSTWVASLQTTNPAILQFSINEVMMGQPFHAYDSTCDWYQFYHVWNSGANTQATISIVNQNTNISGNDFLLDDISFAPVLVYNDTVWVEVLPQLNARFHSPATACAQDVISVNYNGNAPANSNFHWNFGGGTILSGSGPGPYELTYSTPGSTAISLWVEGEGCPSSLKVHDLLIGDYPAVNVSADDTVLNYGTSTTLHGSASGNPGPLTYSWSPADLLVDPTVPDPQTLGMESATSFILTVTDQSTQCTGYDNVLIEVIGGPLSVVINPDRPAICNGDTTTLTAFANGGNQGNYTYTWNDNLGNFYPSTPQIMVFPHDTVQFHVAVDDGFHQVDGYCTLIVHSAEFNWTGGEEIFETCPYDSVLLKPEPNPSTWNYLWSNGAVTDQTFATVTSIGHDIQHFTLTTTTEDGCTFTKSATVIFDFSFCVGISEENQDSPVTIMPNPNQGKFRVLWNNQEEFREILIYSPLGGKVFEKNIAGKNHEIDIDLHQMPAGLYILYLRGSSGLLARKVIIGP